MVEYKFRGQVKKVKQKYVMQLYLEGQNEPIHEMKLDNGTPEFPTQTVDLTFQDYIDNSNGRFNEVADEKIRRLLLNYRSEQIIRVPCTDRNFIFMSDPNAKANTGLEFILIEKIQQVTEGPQ